MPAYARVVRVYVATLFLLVAALLSLLVLRRDMAGVAPVDTWQSVAFELLVYLTVASVSDRRSPAGRVITRAAGMAGVRAGFAVVVAGALSWLWGPAEFSWALEQALYKSQPVVLAQVLLVVLWFALPRQSTSREPGEVPLATQMGLLIRTGRDQAEEELLAQAAARRPEIRFIPGEQAGQCMGFRDILFTLGEIEGVRGCLLVCRDGRVVAERVPKGVDRDRLAVAALKLVESGEDALSGLGLGRACYINGVAGDSVVAVIPVGELVLTVVSDRALEPGHLLPALQEVSRSIDALACAGQAS
ncbi:MAG: roadblock/LC7 domain-containing protein [Firmicutes bacterium]|jgi:predicted regulator of Ras-like GTPase activity (Roadblock/LC7/MglB family)|nr:roadblock/LC7 domain-containing protein [Bacillota bacterium]